MARGSQNGESSLIHPVISNQAEARALPSGQETVEFFEDLHLSQSPVSGPRHLKRSEVTPDRARTCVSTGLWMGPPQG